MDKETNLCSDGLAAEFGVADDAKERERCYMRRCNGQPDADVLAAPDPATVDEDDNLAERAKRFAQVEVRPDQQAFRKAVFMGCGGVCVVSGCDVSEALDAAHLKGRDWRQGTIRPLMASYSGRTFTPYMTVDFFDLLMGV